MPEPHRQQGGPLSVLASLGKEPLRPDLIIIDRLLGDGDCPRPCALRRSCSCAAPPGPACACGWPEGRPRHLEFKDKPYPVEVIPAITVRCVRSTLRKLFDRKKRAWGHARRSRRSRRICRPCASS
ncbi:MAG: hypothetical protein ACLR0N_13250 [Bilophila wadsworthia]